MLLRSYGTPIDGEFVLNCCFGGPADMFVISGGIGRQQEFAPTDSNVLPIQLDGSISIFHRDGAQLLANLNGHTAHVNAAVANPGILASASDDKTVLIWSCS